MERRTLHVTVHAPEHLVDPSLLRRFADAMEKFFEGASDAEWSFVKLAVGSVITEAVPRVKSTEDRDAAFRAIIAGFGDLGDGFMPKGWKIPALRGVTALGELGHRVTIAFTAESEGVDVAPLAEAAGQLLESERVSIGSVEGVIERVNLHGSPNCGIVDRATGQIVTISFGRESRDKVMDLFHAQVQVVARGRLFRDITGRKKRLTLESLSPLPPRSGLTVRDVAGALGPLPDGMDSVSWVRRQRA